MPRDPCDIFGRSLLLPCELVEIESRQWVDLTADFHPFNMIVRGFEPRSVTRQVHVSVKLLP